MIRSQINGTSGYCANMEVNSCLVVTYSLKDRMIMIIFNDPLKCDDHLSSVLSVCSSHTPRTPQADATKKSWVEDGGERVGGRGGGGGGEGGGGGGRHWAGPKHLSLFLISIENPMWLHIQCWRHELVLDWQRGTNHDLYFAHSLGRLYHLWDGLYHPLHGLYHTLGGLPISFFGWIMSYFE